jgi:hypothetical protein
MDGSRLPSCGMAGRQNGWDRARRTRRTENRPGACGRGRPFSLTLFERGYRILFVRDEDAGATASAAHEAATLVGQFDRMVKRDGGSVTLLGVDGDVIRVSYAPGVDPDCTDGVCVMPHVELQQLMAETLARRAPSLQVVVEPAS